MPSGYYKDTGLPYKQGFKKGNKLGNRFIKGYKQTEEVKKYLSVLYKGKHHSPETEFKKGQMSDSNHPGWLDDDVSYRGLHMWVERKLGKPGTCEKCGKTGLWGHEIGWANITGKYSRNINDWMRLCVSCHYYYDRSNKSSK